MSYRDLKRRALSAAMRTFLILAGCLTHAHGQTQAQFEQCLVRLQPAAQKAGVDAASFRQFTQGTQADFTVLEKLDYQPEFKLAIWDYLAALVDEERIADGREMLQRHATTLQRVAVAYGVDPATVAGIHRAAPNRFAALSPCGRLRIMDWTGFG